jgi:hypothetical protein
MTPEELAAKEAADAAASAVPSWAQQLIDQNADLTDRLSAFEDKLQTPTPTPAPVVDEDEWKPSSWSDVDARAEERARKIVEDTFTERETAAKTASDSQQAAADEVDKYLDSQVTELTKLNALPSITNENDPNDPGRLAQRELYGFALSLGTADLKSSHKTLDALHQAGKQFDFVKMELVDKAPSLMGRNSPVSSSSGGAPSGSIRPDYKTLHNTSLDALAHRFTQNS